MNLEIPLLIRKFQDAMRLQLVTDYKQIWLFMTTYFLILHPLVIVGMIHYKLRSDFITRM